MQNTSKIKTIQTNPLSVVSPGENVRVKLKICGMKYPKNIHEIGMLLPDYMGFIFWEKSARYCDTIIPSLPQSIKKVGVFVNASCEYIFEKWDQYDLQAIQLHGEESVEFCNHLKKMLDKKVEIIKVFSILDTFDFSLLEPFELVCDYYLFDTKGKLPGGNGATFDWKVLAEYPSKKPFFLSGGIGIKELEAVHEISKTNLPLYAVDINSKFEIEPGLKNLGLCHQAKEMCFTQEIK